MLPNPLGSVNLSDSGTTGVWICKLTDSVHTVFRSSQAVTEIVRLKVMKK